MPINPNIALGIQPIQQPNMLAQYAQVMGIKAAQQEMEGSQEARDYFSRPVSERGDPSRLLGTKQGQAAYKALNEGQIKQLEATQKRVNLIGAGAGAVLENPTVENFRNVVENLVKNQVYSREDADKAIATIGNDPSKIPSFVTPLYRQAISAEKDLSDKTSRRNQDVASGPGYQQAALAREKFEFEKANPGFEYKTLNDGSIAAVNKRSNAVTILQAPSAAPAPVTPPVNALTPTPAVNLNALVNPPVVNQPGAPTIANAAALAPTPLRAAPRPGYQYNAQGQQVPITDPTKVVNTVTDKFGNVSMINAAGEVIRKVEGMGKPSAAVEKREAEIKALPATISQAKDALNLINRMVGTPDGKSKPHKGFEGAVGAGMGMRFIPGTSARDFQAMHEQITGGAFMQAFETLKGGGQITEKEGEKATAAITRMSLATSEKEYMVAAREFQEVIRRGIQNAEKELRSGGAISPANTGDIATDPAIKSLLDKYK
jgi:hypothetical protein